jgi:hypothetical protein
MDASQDEPYRKFSKVKFHLFAISPLDWGIQTISTERKPQGTPKPAGWNQVNGMTRCRDVCYNINIYRGNYLGGCDRTLWQYNCYD